MSEQNLIGLTELIEQVKQELLTTSPENENDIPLLSVDSVELELQVTVKNEGKAGIKVGCKSSTNNDSTGKLCSLPEIYDNPKSEI